MSQVPTIKLSPKRPLRPLPGLTPPALKADASIRIVTRNNVTVCVILPDRLSPDQMRLVRCIWPDFIAYPEVNQRWGVWGVLANESWFVSQRKSGLLAGEPISNELQFTAINLAHIRD